MVKACQRVRAFRVSNFRQSIARAPPCHLGTSAKFRRVPGDHHDPLAFFLNFAKA
jgi:hypothetical protein